MHNHILEEHDPRVAFQRIAWEKLVNFRDLEYSLKRDGVVRNNLRGVVEQLVADGLVEVQKAPISDFDTYYLTEDGLTANRTLENLKPHKRTDLPSTRAVG